MTSQWHVHCAVMDVDVVRRSNTVLIYSSNFHFRTRVWFWGLWRDIGSERSGSALSFRSKTRTFSTANTAVRTHCILDLHKCMHMYATLLCLKISSAKMRCWRTKTVCVEGTSTRSTAQYVAVGTDTLEHFVKSLRCQWAKTVGSKSCLLNQRFNTLLRPTMALKIICPFKNAPGVFPWEHDITKIKCTNYIISTCYCSIFHDVICSRVGLTELSFGSRIGSVFTVATLPTPAFTGLK